MDSGWPAASHLKVRYATCRGLNQLRSVQNLCWLMIMDDYTTQYIEWDFGILFQLLNSRLKKSIRVWLSPTSFRGSVSETQQRTAPISRTSLAPGRMIFYYVRQKNSEYWLGFPTNPSQEMDRHGEKNTGISWDIQRYPEIFWDILRYSEIFWDIPSFPPVPFELPWPP